MVEIDTYTYHRSWAQRQRDLDRDADLKVHGYEVLRFTRERIESAADVVGCDRLRHCWQRRGRPPCHLGCGARCGSTSSPCSRSGSSGSRPSATCATWSPAGSELRFLDYRETTPLGAGQVDDSPYGGGAGMVMRVDVVDAALEAAYGDRRGGRRIVLLTPSGRTFDEELATELAAEPELALLCGRYEGVDERVRDHLVTDAVSIGRYVLAGGELAAMVVADAVLRKLPGALGHADSAIEESFSRRRSRAIPSTRTTPARRATAAGASPRCCSPATTSGSGSGASSAAASGAGRARRRLATIRRPRGRRPVATGARAADRRLGPAASRRAGPKP